MKNPHSGAIFKPSIHLRYPMSLFRIAGAARALAAATALGLLASCGIFWGDPAPKQDTPLLKSIRRADAEAFDKALQGPDVNVPDLLGRTPLMVASGEDRLPFVQALLKKGANVDAVDKMGNSALHCAASTGIPEAAEALLDAGADPSMKNSYGWTPLAEAARLGNYGVARALVEKGSPIDNKDCSGKTPLAHAAGATRNSNEIVCLLLDKGASPNSYDDEGLTPLMWAIKEGNENAAMSIISKTGSLKEDIDFGLLAMQWAIKCDDISMVKALVEKDVPLNLENSMFVSVSRGLQAKGISKVFSNYGLIKENRTPLMWAALYAKPQIAAFLIAKGSDVRARDYHGNTALDYAKDYATQKIIKQAGGN